MDTYNHNGKSLALGSLLLSAALFHASTATAQDESFERGSQLISLFTGPFFDLGGESEDSDLTRSVGLATPLRDPPSRFGNRMS